MNIVSELPKAELHLHLEGSIAPETVHELDPACTVEEARARYQYRNFADFIECFKWVSSLLRGPDEYALAVERLLEHLATQQVHYAEITLAAGVVLWKQQDFAPIYRAVRAAAARSPIRVRWILDAVRHFGSDPARQVAELAAERAGDGVVAFGIGGDESRGPATWFREVFAFARERGLRLTAHAGETTDARSVWEAIEIGAERIGHGIRAAGDPQLLDYLRDHDLPLEICLSSNVATGAVASLKDHPLRRILDAGVPVILNTDDPAMFHTTLSREYELAGRHFGLSGALLKKLAANSFQYAFDSSR